MPPPAIQLRVKRKGSGRLTVTVEDEDIGTTPATIEWIRKQDSDPQDPGDKFTFKSLTGLPPRFFSTPHVEKTKVTSDYYGCTTPNMEWKYHIEVDDYNMDGTLCVPHTDSDGTATIKNH